MVTEAYLLLAASTLLLAALVWIIWLRTRAMGFVAGIALLYYWSLYGAWGLVDDLMHPNEPRRYQYLFGKMFGVNLDADYLASLAGYGAFLVALSVAVLVMASDKRVGKDISPIQVSHRRLIAFGYGCLIAAVLLIRGQLLEAVALGLSGYSVTAAGDQISPWFTLHQTFNKLAILPAAIGVSVLLTGVNGRLIAAQRKPATWASYGSFVVVLFAYGMLMGNKAELFFGAISTVVLYSLNAREPRWSGLAVSAVAILVAMGLVDYARSLTVSELTGAMSWTKVVEAVEAIANSNEAYAAHFSLYGVMHYQVPLTWGSSLVSLAAAVVPRVLWADRPGTVYEHYAGYLGMVDGQGYTLHHATGWYLNFGWVGIALGGLLLGFFWAAPYRLLRRAQANQRRSLTIFAAVAFSFVTGYLPSLVRAGIEGYKSVVAFAIIMPVLLVLAVRNSESTS